MMNVDPVQVVAAAICHHHRVLVAQRSAAMSLPHKWEFPGGKVSPGESPRDALRREIREELGIDIEVGALLGTGRSSETGRPILLAVYFATAVNLGLTVTEHSCVRWITADELDRYDWAEADRPVLAKLATALRKDTSDSMTR